MVLLKSELTTPTKVLYGLRLRFGSRGGSRFCPEPRLIGRIAVRPSSWVGAELCGRGAPTVIPWSDLPPN
eukprot:2611151-Prymnesium_polylepis.1